MHQNIYRYIHSPTHNNTHHLIHILHCTPSLALPPPHSYIPLHTLLPFVTPSQHPLNALPTETIALYHPSLSIQSTPSHTHIPSQQKPWLYTTLPSQYNPPLSDTHTLSTPSQRPPSLPPSVLPTETLAGYHLRRHEIVFLQLRYR